MLLPLSSPRRAATLAIFILFILYFWVFLRRHYGFELMGHSEPTTGPPEPFNPAALERVCSEQQRWLPNIVFTCDKSFGGIGNLRNSILNCVRYSIAAGASLVMPRIVLRNTEDIHDLLTNDLAEIEYMFDRAHFITSLQQACPQLRLYNHIKDVPNHRIALNVTLLPESLEKFIPATGLVHPEYWTSSFYTWLGVSAPVTAAATVLVNLQRSYLQYPVYHDGEEFVMSFGGILKFRDDARHLAGRVLQRISEVYSLHLDLSQPIPPNGFFGTHLRTEADAVQAWPPGDSWWHSSAYSEQSKVYLEQALKSNASVIFLANGNQTEIEKFKSDALVLGIQVANKMDLLKGNDLEMLHRLTWDQQALVDFLVLLRATDFGGIAHSSFAWNIALKRHVYSSIPNPLDGPQMFSDEYSQVYGVVRRYPEYAACMWP